MFFIPFLILISTNHVISSQLWNTSGSLLPWESYLRLGDIQRPLGLTLNRSSLAHHHFAIGYLCLHSFMYDEAQEAFNLAINTTPTFIEAYIGKMLGCKHALWAYTDFDCGLAAYHAAKLMLKTSNKTLSPLQMSLLSAVYQWYANQSFIAAGERAFLSAVTNISQTYPNETDIHVLRGLSLLNNAYDKQFEGQPEPKSMIEAREILRTALKNEPTHPGALHYLIHAYDIDQVAVIEKATDYALIYNKSVLSLSHAQHMSAHIWMRLGAWLLAVSADGSAIEASLSLCATKVLNRHISVSSTDLKSVLEQFNSTRQVSAFLLCDAENRAHSTEWLSYSRLQTGNWLGSISLLRDLFVAENESLLKRNHYLPFAYRTQARTIIELFFWFPYGNQFLSKVQSILEFSKGQSLVLFDDTATDWYPIWGEAGYRFADCLKLLAIHQNTANTSSSSSTIDDHLARLLVLSNLTNSSSKYISKSILMMIPQIVAMRLYVNGSWQECLNELYKAVQLESTLVANSNSPTLLYARSSELLAMHLLIIYEKHQEDLVWNNSSEYILNDTAMSVETLPLKALHLYKNADQTAPNRAINTIGMARSHVHLGQHQAAASLYQQILYQMTSSNKTEDIFLREPNEYLDQYNSAERRCAFSVLFIFVALLLF